MQIRPADWFACVKNVWRFFIFPFLLVFYRSDAFVKSKLTLCLEIEVYVFKLGPLFYCCNTPYGALCVHTPLVAWLKWIKQCTINAHLSMNSCYLDTVHRAVIMHIYSASRLVPTGNPNFLNSACVCLRVCVCSLAPPILNACNYKSAL